MILTWSDLTSEYVRVKVAMKQSGAWVDPTGDTVEFAFPAAGEDPVSLDWSEGDWETDTTTTPDSYYARIIPSVAGAVGEYDIWVRITDVPEVPVRNVGELHIS